MAPRPDDEQVRLRGVAEQSVERTTVVRMQMYRGRRSRTEHLAHPVAQRVFSTCLLRPPRAARDLPGVDHDELGVPSGRLATRPPQRDGGLQRQVDADGDSTVQMREPARCIAGHDNHWGAAVVQAVGRHRAAQVVSRPHNPAGRHLGAVRRAQVREVRAGTPR